MRDLLVDEDISKAEGLPARAFTDPEVLRLELETIFKNNWLLVPEPSGEAARTDARAWTARLRGVRSGLAPHWFHHAVSRALASK